MGRNKVKEGERESESEREREREALVVPSLYLFDD
jgi:hypothetical protein